MFLYIRPLSGLILLVLAVKAGLIMLHHLILICYHNPFLVQMHFRFSCSTKCTLKWLCMLAWSVLSIVACTSCGSISSSAPPPVPPPLPLCSPLVIPTPASVATDPVSRFVRRYEGFVLKGEDDAAYPMLSDEQRHAVSRQQFMKDMNYTLMPGFWTVVSEQPPRLEKDGVTWEMGFLMAYVPYDKKVRQTFYWHFQVRKEHGKLAVVGIGLTGTSICSLAT